MAYGDFKDLSRRTASDKVLRNKAFSIAKNPKCGGYQSGLASMVYTFFMEKALVEQLTPCQINNLQMNFTNQLLKKLQNELFIHHLKTIFGVLIL